MQSSFRLGIAAAKPLYFIAGIIPGFGTVTLSVMEPDGSGRLPRGRDPER